MNDFARVNGGVALGAQVFTPTHANNLRTNAELLWENDVTRFIRSDVDVTDLGYQHTSTFGPLSWHDRFGCYMAATSNPSAAGQLLLTVGKSSPAIVSQIVNSLSASVGSYVPVIFGGADYYVYQAYQSATSTTSIAYTTDWGSWTVATTATFVPCTTAPPIYAFGQVALCGTNGSAGNGSILVVTPTGSTITTKACPATGTGELTSIATDGSTVAAICPVAAYGKQAPLSGVGTGSDFAITAPAAADVTTARIAYDARTAQWVVFCQGATGTRTYMYWCPQSTPGWATGTWRRFNTGLTLHDERAMLRDFTITKDGIWLALCETHISYGVYHRIVYSSIDAGANWTKHSLGLVRNNTGAPTSYPRFSANTGAFVATIARPSTTTVEVYSSGQINTGTAIASTTV